MEGGARSSLEDAAAHEGPLRQSLLEDGAGLGDVGVKRFNDVAVFLFDNAALEFEGEGEAAIINSKIFGEQREALDAFILRQMGREALHFRIDQGVHPGMSNHLADGSKRDSL